MKIRPIFFEWLVYNFLMFIIVYFLPYLLIKPEGKWMAEFLSYFFVLTTLPLCMVMSGLFMGIYRK